MYMYCINYTLYIIAFTICLLIITYGITSLISYNAYLIYTTTIV